MNSAPALSVREPFFLRALRSVALLGLTLVLTLLLVLLSQSVPGIAALTEAVTAAVQKASLLVQIVAFWALPVVLFFVAWRLGRRSWWWIGGGWLVVIPLLAYLAADEPARRIVRLEELSPAFPGAEQSYAVLMRYGKNHPSSDAVAFRKIPQQLAAFPAGPTQPAEFSAFLIAHRDLIEAEWTALAPQRRWLDELNAFDRIGDLGAARLDTDILRFKDWRTFSQLSAAKAGLLALDGRGDDAIATLLPVLSVSRKLEPSARTLVRFIVARTVQHVLIDTAAFTLRQTTVSPATRAQLASVLQLGVGGEAGARRLVIVDYAVVADSFSDLSFSELMNGGQNIGLPRYPFNLIGCFVYNPQRTINTYGDLIGELQDLAARREYEKIDPRAVDFWAHEGRPSFKNLAGRTISQMISPSLSKHVESYWRIEDKRTALLTQLATP